MTAWSDFLSTLRTGVLKDTSDTPRWADAVLLDYANLAIRDISKHIPATAVVESLSHVEGFNTVTKPTNFLRLRNVLLDDTPIRSYKLGSVDAKKSIEDSRPCYLIDYPTDASFSVVLNTSGTVAYLYYAYRPILDGEDDTEIPVGPYLWAEQAIMAYIAFLANMREGVLRASLEQWGQSPDIKVGNPLNFEAREWWMHYHNLISASVNR